MVCVTISRHLVMVGSVSVSNIKTPKHRQAVLIVLHLMSRETAQPAVIAVYVMVTLQTYSSMPTAILQAEY